MGTFEVEGHCFACHHENCKYVSRCKYRCTTHYNKKHEGVDKDKHKMLKLTGEEVERLYGADELRRHEKKGSLKTSADVQETARKKAWATRRSNNAQSQPMSQPTHQAASTHHHAQTLQSSLQALQLSNVIPHIPATVPSPSLSTIQSHRTANDLLQPGVLTLTSKLNSSHTAPQPDSSKESQLTDNAMSLEAGMPQVLESLHNIEAAKQQHAPANDDLESLIDESLLGSPTDSIAQEDLFTGQPPEFEFDTIISAEEVSPQPSRQVSPFQAEREQPKARSFMDLPPEVRVCIFEKLLVLNHTQPQRDWASRRSYWSTRDENSIVLADYTPPVIPDIEGMNVNHFAPGGGYDVEGAEHLSHAIAPPVEAHTGSASVVGLRNDDADSRQYGGNAWGQSPWEAEEFADSFWLPALQISQDLRGEAVAAFLRKNFIIHLNTYYYDLSMIELLEGMLQEIAFQHINPNFQDDPLFQGMSSAKITLVVDDDRDNSTPVRVPGTGAVTVHHLFAYDTASFSKLIHVLSKSGRRMRKYAMTVNFLDLSGRPMHQRISMKMRRFLGYLRWLDEFEVWGAPSTSYMDAQLKSLGTVWDDSMLTHVRLLAQICNEAKGLYEEGSLEDCEQVCKYGLHFVHQRRDDNSTQLEFESADDDNWWKTFTAIACETALWWATALLAHVEGVMPPGSPPKWTLAPKQIDALRFGLTWSDGALIFPGWRKKSRALAHDVCARLHNILACHETDDLIVNGAQAWRDVLIDFKSPRGTSSNHTWEAFRHAKLAIRLSSRERPQANRIYENARRGLLDHGISIEQFDDYWKVKLGNGKTWEGDRRKVLTLFTLDHIAQMQERPDHHGEFDFWLNEVDA